MRKMNTLIDRIQEELLSDDEDREEQSEYLKRYYTESSEAERRMIDLCFIALCGWSLKTLMEQ